MAASIISGPTVAVVAHYARELPLFWFLAGCLLAGLGFAVLSARFPRHRFALMRGIAVAAGFSSLLTYVGLALYSLRCYMMQSDEANILGVAAVSLHGPMYLPPGSPEASISLMYGPVTFLIYRAGLILGGADHFWVMRCLIVAADLGLAVALYTLLRRFVSAFLAIALLSFPLSVLLQHPEGSMGIRSDLWIIFFTTLAILCSYLEVELLAILLTGIMGGAIIGLKISAAPAILFPLLVVYRRFGLGKAVVCAALVAAAALAPFALPNVSLPSYMSWILFTRSEGISAKIFWPNLMFALFLLSPCLLMERFARRSGAAFKQRLPDLLLIAFCLVLAVLTSKPGSGPWYMWHMVPSIVVYLAFTAKAMNGTVPEERVRPVYYIAVACALLVGVNLSRACADMRVSVTSPGVVLARQALLQNLDRYKDHSSVQMGFGSVAEEDTTSLRYILAYQGQPYTLEGNTGRFETALLPFPAKVLDRMTNCTDDVWLIPHAQKPFALYLFPEDLRRTFADHYRIDSSDATYDAWVCDRARTH